MALVRISTVDYPKTVTIDRSDFGVVTMNDLENRYVTINEMLPFKVRFTNITLETDGYGPGSPAPIGIAVLGYNNYIL